MKKQSKGLKNRNRWKEISEELRRERPYCEYCCREKSTQVHHLVSKYFKKSLLRFEKYNLVCLCGRCHFIFHKNPVSTMSWLRVTRPQDHETLLLVLSK